MRAKLLLMALGAIMAAGGLLLASTPIQLNPADTCNVNVGCSTTAATTIPSLGIGVLVFILGFVLIVYGYLRKEESDQN